MTIPGGGRRPATPPPEPPHERIWRVPTSRIPHGTPLYHLSRAHHRSGKHFGRGTGARFDAPAGGYGVVYVGLTLECALLEVVRTTRRPGAVCVVSEAELATWNVWKVRPERDLKVVNLSGRGLRWVGADVRVTGGNDYGLSQRWSAAIHAHPSRFDGIYYTTRHGDDLGALTLYDRAGADLTVTLWGRVGNRAVPRLWVETTTILDDNKITIIPP